MKTILRGLSLSFFLAAAAFAAEDGSPKAVAQSFYDGYMKVLRSNGDTQKFVLASGSLTAGFKKAYAKLIADGMESDPIICGQDYPDAGFEASSPKIQGDKATLAMKSRGDELEHSFRITLRLAGGRWLISDTNDLKADADD